LAALKKKPRVLLVDESPKTIENDPARVASVLGSRLYGMKQQDIATQLNMPLGEVKAILRTHAAKIDNWPQGQLAIAGPSPMFAGSTMPPYNPDVLVQRKGLGIFDQMRRDDQVKAALTFKKLAMLSTGWEITGPDGFKLENKQDWEPANFLDWVLRHVEGSFDDILYEYLTALDYGYAVGELIYDEIPDGPYAGKVGLSAIKMLKPHYVHFEVDIKGNITWDGILQRTAHGFFRLPVNKFATFTYQEEFGNPYGRSDLDNAYRAWWIKENTYRWLAMLLERFGIPPIFALYNPNGMAPGQVTQLMNIINRIQASTAGAIPRMGKDALELWSPELAGQTERVFLPALNFFNGDIARALLMPGQLGMTPDSQQGSFAKSKVHFDVFLLGVLFQRKQLEEVLVFDQIIRPLMDYNYTLDAYPRMRFLPITDDLRLDIMDSWGKLVGTGVVQPQPSDEEHIRTTVGFPAKDPGQPDAPGPFPGVPGAAGTSGGGGGNSRVPSPSRGGGPPPTPSQAPSVAPAAERREANRYERGMDFALVHDILDRVESKAKDKLVNAFLAAKERFIAFAKKDLKAAKGVHVLRTSAPIRKAYADFVQAAYGEGFQSLRRELPRQYGNLPAVRPAHAIRYIRERADFFITGVDDALTKQAAEVLADAFDKGEPLEETIANLEDLFTPYVGGSVKEEVVEPWRLETIIRTNATDAFNAGRLAQARENLDYLSGFEYSAVIDQRTTDVCQFLDGKVFEVNSPYLDTLRPPRHYNCRSVLVPLTPDIDIADEDVLTDEDAREAQVLTAEAGGGDFAQQEAAWHAYINNLGYDDWRVMYSPDQPRVPAGSSDGGEFAPGEGGGGVSLKPVNQRAFLGKQKNVRSKLSKQATGALGESIGLSLIRDKYPDARHLNDEKANFPVDLIADHELTEVKTGLVSNGTQAQQWRATIGQPGVAEAKWLAKASPEEKAEWNADKQQQIIDRKNQVVADYSKKLGKNVKGSTLCLIVDPDKKVADVYKFKGFHSRIGWNSPEAKKAYVGSYKYG